MRTRTAILATIAAAALIGDGYWLYQHYFGLNAAITYVGVDTFDERVPVSAKAAQLRDGKWDSDPYQTLSALFPPPPGQEPRPIAFVSLGSDPGFGHAIALFRDLKARHICHVVVRESGVATDYKGDFGKGPEAVMEAPVWVLCGDTYGDAYSIGQLPADRLIHDSEAR